MPTTRRAAGTRAEGGKPTALRTNATAARPQRSPRAPDSPWGRLRGARGWSLRDLSALTGINTADLSRIERGIGGATPDQARALLAVYDTVAVEA